MLKQSVSLLVLTLSLGSLASCSKNVADKPVDTVKSAPTGAMTATKSATTVAPATNKPATAGALAVIPAGITIDTDLQQELSSGKNRDNDRFVIKVKNGSVGKYPALKDATIEGHLEKVTKATKGKKAQMNLAFDQLKLKNGDLLPIDAALVNTKVETKTKGQFIKNAGIILGGTIAGNFIGDKTKFKHGKLAGAAAATAFVLSSPGGEVVLKKGTDLQLKLKSAVDPN
ncbi:hypothetical protein [Chamaesiphon minutus]|uniref:Lipoprotein n=1 Tax=Chamaesiphon minutus (strain ATCC 27169 / PCC 6605) TaxID=1173020 RepID=K9UBE9_CHAP6|nr:hypothetical protein [Chamaesiphon minutus]AFY91549.1 hypothetical protein Cha6605_0247 [Chamaesiphon minutus PCC 6605]